jgi:hypothetical protein
MALLQTGLDGIHLHGEDTQDMPLPQPPPPTPFQSLSRAQKVEVLREQLGRATEFVAVSDDFARRNQDLAMRLMQGIVPLASRPRRERELIAEAARERGASRRSTPSASSEAHQREILLARRLIAEGRVARRESRRHMHYVARRLAELEEQA